MHFTDITKVKELESGRCYWNENQQPVYTLKKRDIHTCCSNFSGRRFCKSKSYLASISKYINIFTLKIFQNIKNWELVDIMFE